MTQIKDVMLPIRLPAELKDMFQTLCKTRGVSVSAELRRLMAYEVSQAAMGVVATNQKPQAKIIDPNKKKPIEKNQKHTVVENRKSSRCNDTSDMFYNAPKTSLNAPDTVSITESNTDTDSFIIEMLNSEPESHLGLSSPVSAFNRTKKRKKRKK